MNIIQNEKIKTPKTDGESRTEQNDSRMTIPQSKQSGIPTNSFSSLFKSPRWITNLWNTVLVSSKRLVHSIFLNRSIERFYLVFGGHIFLSLIHISSIFPPDRARQRQSVKP